MNRKTPPEWENIEEGLADWDGVRGEVTSILEAVAADNFRTRPADGSWSAAEIGDHLYLSQWSVARSLPIVLAGKFGEPTTFKRPGEYRIYLGATTKPGKAKNPESVTPSAEKTKEQVLADLRDAASRLRRNATGKSIAELAARGYPHPYFGPLSLADWIWVMTQHERGHLVSLRAKFA